MPFKFYKYLLLSIFFVACKQNAPTDAKQIVSNRTNLVSLAKRFAIVKQNNLKWVYIFGNRNNYDTTAKFLLSEDTIGLNKIYSKASIVKTPLAKVAALGSIYATMIDSLGALQSLAAIDDIRYVSNAHIIQKHNNNLLIELATNPQIDIEKTVRLHPQMVFSFGMGEGEKDIDKKLALTKIPNCIIIDHLEETPLARAEWIKLIAAFFNKDEKAEALFNATQKNYETLKQKAQTSKNKPTVFTEAKFGDVWYMPGGKSFMATLINDAGGNYLWQSDQQVGSIPLSLEQVFAKAKDADIWLNPSQCKTLNELLQSEKRYTAFKAFNTKQVYNNNLHLNQYGYSNYWESGLMFPDKILSDLIYIFHPELKPHETVTFNYYKQLN